MGESSDQGGVINTCAVGQSANGQSLDLLEFHLDLGLFEWLAFDFSAPLKSFDHRLFVGGFAVFFICLHSIIISWCMIGTAAKETVLEMIRNTNSMDAVI